MELVEGQRLSASEHGGYIVGHCIKQTPWYRLYAARKVFTNYRYAEREFYEAAEDEWLDVLIRACPDRGEPPSAAAEQSSKLLRYEAQEVLGDLNGWLPQPIDLLELESAGDGWHVSATKSPGRRRTAHRSGQTVERLLVLSQAHGQSLHEWRSAGRVDPAQALHVVAEILDLLDRLHEKGQVMGGFSPDDFLIDDTGRWSCLCSDRVMAGARATELRPCFPPERFPQGFSAPETREPQTALCAASDLYAWAALSLFLLTGEDPADDDSSSASGPVINAQNREQLVAALADATEREPDLLTTMTAPGYRRTGQALVLSWVESLTRCLSPDVQARPGSIDELRQGAAKQSGRFSLKRLWRQVVGAK